MSKKKKKMLNLESLRVLCKKKYLLLLTFLLFLRSVASSLLSAVKFAPKHTLNYMPDKPEKTTWDTG